MKAYQTLSSKGLKERLPVYLQERVLTIKAEDGLIDDCLYMVYFADGWTLAGDDVMPVKSIKEAIYFIKDAQRK
jgi:hypothetical protein